MLGKNQEIAEPDLIAKPNIFQALASRITPVFFMVGGALLIRLLLVPFTMHGDMIALAWSARVLALGDWNIYDTGLRLWVEKGWALGVTPISHGPLFYYLYGAWLWFSGLLKLFPVEHWNNYTSDGLTPLNLLVLKTPAFIADGIAAYYFSRIFKGQQRLLALGLWLFAPLELYFTFASGQDDIYITTTLCVTLYYGSRSLQIANEKYAQGQFQPFWQKEAGLALVALGLGVCFKLFPVFLLPLAAIILGKRAGHTVFEDYKRVVLFFGCGLAPIVLIFGPLTLFSKTFLSSVLLSGETNALSGLNFVSGTGYLAWFWFFYFAILAHLVFEANKTHTYNFTDLATYLGLVTILFTIIGAYPSQFLLWSLPFLLLMVVQRPSLYPGYLIIILCYIMAVFSYPFNLDPNGLYALRDRDTLKTGSPKDLLSQILPWTQLVSITTPIYVVTILSMLGLYSQATRNKIAAALSFFIKKPDEDRFTTPQADHAQKNFKLSQRPSGFFFLLPFGLFFGIILLLFFLAVSTTGIYKVNQANREAFLAFLTKTTQIDQAFIAPAGTLEKLEIAFGTGARYNTAKIQFQLFDSKQFNSELIHTTIDSFYLKDGGYYAIKLPQPLKLDQPTNLSFRLTSPDGLVGNSVAVFGTSTKNPPKVFGTVFNTQINGLATDKLVEFKVSYRVDWGEKLNILNSFMATTPLFTTLYWITCFSLAVLLIFGWVVRRNQPWLKGKDTLR